MAKVKVVIESDEAINVKVTKKPEESVGLGKLKEGIEQVDDEADEQGGEGDAAENT